LQSKITQSLPNWFKSNAKWWKEGSITETDIILAIENLVDQGIIKIKPNPQSQTSEQYNIPSYIKNVFGFWSEGNVSDSEIANSLQYLIDNSIIKSKKLSETPEQNFPALEDTKILKNLYLASSWQEFASFTLLKIKNYEKNTLDDLSKKAWLDYAKNKNQTMMEHAQLLDSSKIKTNNQSLEAVKIQHSIKNTKDQIELAAIKAGLSNTDLTNYIKEIKDKKDSFGDLVDDKALRNAYETGNQALEKSNSIQQYLSGFQGISFWSNSQTSLNKMIEMFAESPLLKTQFDPVIKNKAAIKVLSQNFSYDPMDGRDLCDDSLNDYEIFLNIIFSEKFSGTFPNMWYRDGEPLIPGNISIKDGIVSGTIKNFPEGNWTLKILKSDLPGLEEDVVVYVNIPPTECSTYAFIPAKPPIEPEGKLVTVLVIGGKSYPVLQFKSTHPDNCLEFHYHSIFSRVRSIDGVFISDPDKANCGFGSIDSIPVMDDFMTLDQIDAFTKDMGISP
jgi:hypothetical protein